MLTVKEVITSRQNPTVKQVCALLDKKTRRETGLFRFDGIKLFREASANGLEIKLAVLSESSFQLVGEHVEKAIRNRSLCCDNVMTVSDELFTKISEEKSPEGIITVARFPENLHKFVDEASARAYTAEIADRLMIVKSIRDPGNLGTVIRSCASLGIDRLVLSDDCADIYNPKTIRGTMGGLFRQKIDILPCDLLSDAITSLRNSGRRVFATALHTDAAIIGTFELGQGDCFVIGNEAHGLDEKVIGACNGCAIIPMTDGSESLNAAVAAAICIWETVRAKR